MKLPLLILGIAGGLSHPQTAPVQSAASRQACPPILGRHPPVRRALKPGIYQTAPFTGIVLVPGPQADDRAIIRRRGPDLPSRMIEPPLRFIPRSPRGK